MNFKILAIVTLFVVTASRLTAQRSASGTVEVDIPEEPFQIRPSSYFFKLKDPKDFKVARPDAFSDMSTFRTSVLSYTIQASPATVWEKYQKINPLAIWSNSRSRITAVHVPSTGRTLYREDLAGGWTGFETGMKIFLDMSSLPLAVTNKPAMMVGLMITRIDAETRTVVFRYLEGTPSYGEQVFRFRQSESDPEITEVTHETWYRSYGRLVEYIYPLYHKKMIDGMHGRFKWLIECDADQGL